MKKKSKKAAKKIPRKSKSDSLPSTKEADKTFLIAIISIVAVVALFLLLLFSGQFVGKAFFTGQQSNTAGIADPGTVVENQPFSLTVQVNVPAPAKTNTVGFTLQLPTIEGVSDVCSKVVDVDNDASNGINIQNLFGGFETDNKCENNKIYFGTGLVSKSGVIPIAKIDFQGLSSGQYFFNFEEPFQVLHGSGSTSSAGTSIAINVLDPTIEVQSSATICGNGMLEGSEQCDNGANNGDTKACTSLCINNICGDGKQYLGSEECDDGNNADGDDCSSSCELESNAICGDNVCNVKFESTSSCAQDCGLVCPTNGLFSWWKGENNAQDSYKFGHNAVFTDNAAYTPGIIGQAFKFDGLDDLLDLDNKAGTLLADPTNTSLSLSFWMKTAATKSTMYIIDTGAGTDGRRGFYCNTAQGTIYCAVRQAAVIYKVSASNVIPLNSWKYVTLAFDDNTNELKLYVDGSLTKTGTEEQISGDTFISPLSVIGATATTTKSLLFNGSLDEVAVWGRALTSAEVKSLYNSGATGMCSITSFVCGNNVMEAGEECDDGNNDDGDNCSSICQTESAICGDNVCEIKFESTISCPQDCGLVCPTNGLVSWWKGENGLDSFSSHHGILGGNADVTSGKVDSALYFDGDGDYLSLGQKPGTIFSDPSGSSLSVSFWMRTNATQGPQSSALYIVDSGAGTAARRGFYCSTKQGKLDCAIKHANTIYQVSANNAVPLNVWKLVTFTFDQSKEELKLYVDGVSVASGTKAALSSSSSPVPTSVIGATNLQTLSFYGTLDEIAVWDRVLTSSEVKAIFDTSNIGMCAVPEAVCGNGFVETGEECDDSNQITTDSCNLCKNALCGDGIIRLGVEQCDGNNLGTASCQSLNFANGTLSCASSCLFNSTACMVAPEPAPVPPVTTLTVNGTKISLGDIAPVNDTFATLLTATEGFTPKIMIYTILYNADGKVLKLESDELTGMSKDAWLVITANHPLAEVKKKVVLVFDVEANPTVYGKLEKIY